MTAPAPTPATSAEKPAWKPLVLIASTVLLLDQWTKFLAVKHLTTALREVQAEGLVDEIQTWLAHRHPGGRVRVEPLIDSFWSWTYAENPGAAWSFASQWPDAIRIPFFHVVSVIAIGLIGLYYRRLLPNQKLLRVALSLVMGGAFGNLVDRLVRGYVIDFIDWHWNDKAHWPTFNVADVGISVGVGLIALDSLLAGRAAAKTPGGESPDAAPRSA
jgi:signal peptidase II